jgi:hypothetical protein
MRKLLDPLVLLSLVERYPNAKRAGLECAWLIKCAQVEDLVANQYVHAPMAQPALEAAALLRLMAVFAGDDPMAKQALLLASSELLAPFAPRQ